MKDAPGGPRYLAEDAATLQRGKVVFADRCARCHSSDIPPLPSGLDLEGANGPGYLTAWNAYWAWTKTDDFRAQMREKVLRDDFLKGNYLSTELRVPITLLGINACSPLATNAIRDNVWDNFSSESYKTLPSVGSIRIRHPVTGAEYDYTLPGGGRGFIRPASLISLWSTAPFLQNNTVGHFEWSPSVDARTSPIRRRGNRSGSSARAAMSRHASGSRVRCAIRSSGCARRWRRRISLPWRSIPRVPSPSATKDYARRPACPAMR